MNFPLRRVAVACLVLFGLLLVNVTYLQAVRADELRNKPGNVRALYKEYEHQRGPIVVDGKKIAYSKATKDDLKYKRVYRDGPLYAPVTGYYSLFDSTGIEQAQDDVLAGTDSRFFMRRLVNMASGERPKGGSVVLTLNAEAQRAAFQDIKQHGEGAAVALDPQTGDVLAMASSPSYDPNRFASHESEKVKSAYDELQSRDTNPLLSRSISQVYAPGSTFKVVTAAAALSSQKYSPSSVLPAPEVLNLPQTDKSLQNFEGEICDPSGSMSLTAALEMSCNTAFAHLGMQLGPKTLRKQAKAFGFSHTFDVPMRTAPSVFSQDSLSKPATAYSAIGQQNVRTTPMQMAMVAAGIANDGVVMKPNLVDEIQAPDLETVEQPRPEEYGRAVSPEVAQQLTDMMKLVVQQGTGTAVQLPGTTVAGKTGTAEPSPENAWFISFAPAQNPRVAVAVAVPHAGSTGGEVAAPIAKDIMQAVLQQ